MSLRAIVSALGGDLYQNGARANVPAPGHSAADRSISLVLSDGRVVAHGFGAADWRAALDDLTQRGLIDEQRRPRGGGCAASVPHIDLRRRIEAAECLWEGGQAATPAGRAALHLRLRGVPGVMTSRTFAIILRLPSPCTRWDDGREAPCSRRSATSRAR